MYLTDNLNAIYSDRDGGKYNWIEFKTQHKYNHINGPAVICDNGAKGCYRNHRTHNEFGPAIIYVNGTVLYILNGQPIT